jgi:hypothetical protein
VLHKAAGHAKNFTKPETGAQTESVSFGKAGIYANESEWKKAWDEIKVLPLEDLGRLAFTRQKFANRNEDIQL